MGLRRLVAILEGWIQRLEAETPWPWAEVLERRWFSLVYLVRALAPAPLQAWAPVLAAGLVLVPLGGLLWLSAALLLPSPPTRPEVLTPEVRQPLVTSVTPSLSPTPETAPAPLAPEEPEVTATPGEPPAPAPLTPQERLLATIKEPLERATGSYGVRLTNILRTDFVASLLAIELSADWYDLAPEKQQHLAQELLSQSRSLNFQSLEVKDEQHHLLARSPVLGDQAVILRSRNLSAGQL